MRDAGSSASITSVAANGIVAVEQDGPDLWLRVEEGERRGPFTGPLQLVPDNAAAPAVDRSDATGRPTSYRGVLEVARSPTADRLVVVNVVPLESYLAGVVPREMPPSFGLEAARAQSVAARGFALSRTARGMHREVGADVCDRADCQEYGGVAAEHSVPSAAVEATRGQVLLAGGQLVEPLYSSTCGGHTEAAALLFGPSAASGGSVPDGELPVELDLTTDGGASAFYTRSWDSHCAAAPRYRWRVSWSRRDLEDLLATGLRRASETSAAAPAFGPTEVLGELKDLVVSRRGRSGRTLELQVHATGGSWMVKRDWTLRQLLSAPAREPLASSAFVLEIDRGGDGQVRGVTALGGGWGHGVGMCQWGARGLAERGWKYEAILAHYYPGTELGQILR